MYSCHFLGLGANFPEFHEWAPTLATSVLTGLFLELFYISNALYSYIAIAIIYLSMVHTCKNTTLILSLYVIMHTLILTSNNFITFQNFTHYYSIIFIISPISYCYIIFTVSLIIMMSTVHVANSCI